MLHDNDPKYTSGLVQTFLFKNGIQQLEYPPYSPDCNPMENLWSELNRRVENRFAKTIEELKMIQMNGRRQMSIFYQIL
jgi:transposase